MTDENDKEFQKWRSFIHRTYRKFATLEKYNKFLKLEKECKSLCLNAGNGLYLFQKDKENFIEFSMNNEQIISKKEAFDLSKRCYHEGNFIEKFDSTSKKEEKTKTTLDSKIKEKLLKIKEAKTAKKQNIER